MPWWLCEVETTGREVYKIEANSEQEARQKFYTTDLPKPSVQEVIYMDTATLRVTEEKS